MKTEGRAQNRARLRDDRPSAWKRLERAILACERCPRLRGHCLEVARTKRRAYQDETYWGRPVPGFGDVNARLLLLGLAPAAHGANRTGRMFTGDRSGDWLYGALYRHGFANRETSTRRDDGLRLDGAYISAACRCAPPGNKPSPEELAACSEWLDREIAMLTELRVVLALGRIGWDAALRSAARAGERSAVPPFAHGAEGRITLVSGRPAVTLLGSYHPSQQNTFTGKLTLPMWDAVFRRARALAMGH